jgi:hypothetical protein
MLAVSLIALGMIGHWTLSAAMERKREIGKK